MNQKIIEQEKREQLELFLNGWDLTTETNEKLVKKIEAGDLIKIDYRNGKLGNCDHGVRFLINDHMYRDPYCDVCDKIIEKIAKNRVNVYYDKTVSKYATIEDISKYSQEALEISEEQFLKRFRAFQTIEEYNRLFQNDEEIGLSLFEQLDKIEDYPLEREHGQIDYLHAIIERFDSILEIEKLYADKTDQELERSKEFLKGHIEDQKRMIQELKDKILKTENKIHKLNNDIKNDFGPLLEQYQKNLEHFERDYKLDEEEQKRRKRD